MNSRRQGRTRSPMTLRTTSTSAGLRDGTKIAFATNRDGNFEIYTMNADGTSRSGITSNPAPGLLQPGLVVRTAPRSSSISNRDGNFEIYTMNADGTGPADSAAAWRQTPCRAWSPDGSRIAFRRRDAVGRLGHLRGGPGWPGVTQLTAATLTPMLRTSSWSPDAQQDRVPVMRTSDDNSASTSMNAGRHELDRTHRDPAI